MSRRSFLLLALQPRQRDRQEHERRASDAERLHLNGRLRLRRTQLSLRGCLRRPACRCWDHESRGFPAPEWQENNHRKARRSCNRRRGIGGFYLTLADYVVNLEELRFARKLDSGVGQ